MEIKVNMECAIRILEKRGFALDDEVKEGSTLSAKKPNDGDPNQVELFQVLCRPPYIRFEAEIDDATQRNVLEALNQGLDGLIKGAQSQAKK